MFGIDVYCDDNCRFFLHMVRSIHPGNSLLCKNRVRLRTIHQMVGPFPGPCEMRELQCTGLPFALYGQVNPRPSPKEKL